MVRKPNLIIPGVPKSGTSSLHSTLVQHSEIYDGGIKEPHTYSWDNRYRNREKIFKKRFQNRTERYIIDSSTTYLVSKYAIDRIIQDTPDAKFIIVARDPIDRIVSHYNWLSSKGLINRKPIEELKAHMNERFDYRVHYFGNYKAYLDFSKYGEQMEHLKELVPEKNIYFVTFEKLFSNFEDAKKDIANFLDLYLGKIAAKKKNITEFKANNKRKRTPLIRRIFNRAKFEVKVLGGHPRGLRVANSCMYKTRREQIEDLLRPYLDKEIELLIDMGYAPSGWKTYQKLYGNY